VLCSESREISYLSRIFPIAKEDAWPKPIRAPSSKGLIRERREDYAGLSRLIGRNAAYVQQYVKRGTPRRLAEADRRVLARYFASTSRCWAGQLRPERARASPVPRLDVEASAGPGALDPGERARDHVAFDPRWLRRIGGAGSFR
jgi:hypothetical protein